MVAKNDVQDQVIMQGEHYNLNSAHHMLCKSYFLGSLLDLSRELFV